MKRTICLILLLSIVAMNILPCFATYEAAELVYNFEDYSSSYADSTAPTSWRFNGDSAADYKMWSAASEKGTSWAVKSISSTKQLQYLSILSNQVKGSQPFAFEGSILRRDKSSVFTIGLRASSATTGIVSFETNGTVKLYGTTASGFTYNLNEWIDYRIILSPTEGESGAKRYAVLLRQGDNYAEAYGTTTFAGNPTQLRFWHNAGSYEAGTEVLIDDVRLYNCDDYSAPGDSGLTALMAAPAPQSGWAYLNAVPVITFNKALSESSKGAFKLNDTAIPQEKVTFSTDNRHAYVNLDGLLEENTTYNLSWTNVESSGGETSSGSISFKTAAKEVVATDINAVYNAGSYSIDMGGVSYTGANKDVAYVVPVYNNATGKMTGVSTQSKTVTGKYSLETMSPIAASDQTETLNVLRWDSISEMNIVADKQTVGSLNTPIVSPYSGEEKIVPEVDYVNETLKISGTGANGAVTIAILKPGKRKADLNIGSAQQVLDYVFEGKAEDKFSVVCPLNNAGGKLTVLVNRQDGKGSTEYADLVTYFSKAKIDETIAKYNAVDANYATLIGETYEIVGMNLGLYDTLNDKTPVYTALASNAPYSGDNALADIRNTFEKAALLQAVNETGDSAAFAKVVKDNFDSFGFDQQPCYKTYQSKKDKIEDELFTAMYGEPHSTYDEIAAAFNEYTVLKAIGKSDIYSEVQSVISNNLDYLDTKVGWSMETHDKLNLSKSVYTAILSQKDSFADLEALKKLFDDEVAKQYSLENSSDGDGGGGGGGGGGTGAGAERPSVTVGVLDPTPTPDTPPSQTTQLPEFKDISSVPWAEEAIVALSDKGILNGRGENRFYPDDFVTREEMVKIIAVAFANEVEITAADKFDDVDEDAWYYEYVNKVSALGILSGISENMFGTGQNLTRQDAAVLLKRTADYAKIALENKGGYSFEDDSSISSYAVDAIYSLRESGIMVGDDDNSYRPQDRITRAEAAKIVYLLLQRGETK